MDERKNNIDIEKKDNNIPLNSLHSRQMENLIKTLSNPRFLGSIHLNKQIDKNFSSIGNLMRSEYQSKLEKSMRNVIFNPFTKILIIVIVIFNIIWFSLNYIF